MNHQRKQLFRVLRFLAITSFFFSNPVRSAEATTYQQVPAKPGERCIVCGARLTGKDIALIVRGRRVPLDRTMVEDFLRNEQKYFASLQPKGALFQEERTEAPGTVQGGISAGWFIFGLYVLTGLVFGGLSGYVAIGRGVAPIPNFFIGFLFSAAGFLYVLTRPRKVQKSEIPPGLVKVPSTRASVACKVCGYPNHPTASRCVSCHSPLTPEESSEVARVK